MTPEEVTAALGAGWAYEAGIGRPWGTWTCGCVEVAHWPALAGEDEEGGEGESPTEWDVSLFAGDGTSRFDCATPEDAIAAALLLLAAEEVAGGAEVALMRPPGALHEVGVLARLHMVRIWGDGDIFPDDARRFAIDLLRAAREAETTDG